MSCSPPILTAHNLRTSLYKPVANLDVTNALGDGEAVNDTVLEFPAVIDARGQFATIAQLNLREVAATAGDIKKPDLYVHLWHGTAPTAPVADAVYATPVGSTYLGVVIVPEAAYRRLNEVTWEAVVKPDDIVLATDTSGSVGSIFAVVLSAETTPVTFASGAALSVRLTTRLHNVISQPV
jgi:hypothetical protein